jgi:uncharacterized protein
MWYSIYCIDKPDSTALRLATREQHLAYVGAAEARGEVRVVLAGPLLGDDGATMAGSLLLIEAETLAAAQAFAESDPYRQSGLFADVAIRPFRKVLPATP